MAPAFCEETRKVLIHCAKKLNLKFHTSGTCVVVEGPRFSSKAESMMFRSWGGDAINMTLVPEVSYFNKPNFILSFCTMPTIKLIIIVFFLVLC